MLHALVLSGMPVCRTRFRIFGIPECSY